MTNVLEVTQATDQARGGRFGSLGPVNSTDVSTNYISPACWSLRLEPSCSPPFQGSRCVEAIWLYRIVLTTLQFAPLARRSPTATSSVFRKFLSSEARTQIQKAIEASPLVLFMKGTPQVPQCGFSRAVIQVLELQGVPPEKMHTYNVLEDSELRSGIKEFSCVYSASYSQMS